MRIWGQPTGRSGGIREPAVAGRFYPARAERLAADVDRYMDEARQEIAVRAAGVSLRRAGTRESRRSAAGDRLVALVVPHAGHVFSGPTAAFAYAAIDPSEVDRVVLLGPAHYVPVDGIGSSAAPAWRTPLGDGELDAGVARELQSQIETVVSADAAHAPEHSLEVQLPFLQRVLPEGWRLVPLIVGAGPPGDVAAVITWCAALPRTLIVVSTDLSHYLDYSSAIAQDARTIRSIVHRRHDSIGSSDACGRYPLRGLLTAAETRRWSVRLLDARNSGDTAGDRDRVVGYAAFAVTAPKPEDPKPREVPDSDTGVRTAPDVVRIVPESRATLLRLARATIQEALSTGRRARFDPGAWPAADPVLRAPGASFVTLRSASGDLLGCIGSLSARQPLIADVAEHAFDAAFRDPRFPPMTRERADGMVIDVSVLSPTTPFPCVSYDDLLRRVPVGGGVVVEAGRRRATFLPAVWEQLTEPPAFLSALWRKAGLAPGEWPAGIAIEVYGSEEFAET